MKCSKLGCNKKPIIRFQDNNNINEYYCLECLVDRLDYIRENKFFHLLENIKKIIPIYTL